MKLTIIIPFLNEGEEVERTVCSIRDTATSDCRIILINDASTDSYDYQSVAERYNSLYIKHTERKGVAGSRQVGVELCDTPYFLLLDAHMRFYEKGWDGMLIGYLEQYPKAVLCSQTRFLYKSADGRVEDRTRTVPCAGYIDFEDKELFRVVWSNVDTEPLSNIVEIPCIIGAAYACSKEYWQHLDGLNGLITYGTDEELISIKAWISGGRCLLIKEWVVGHIYRAEFPYLVLDRDTVYNRLFVAELLLPYETKRRLFIRMRYRFRSSFAEAYDILRANYAQIKRQKAYLRAISLESGIDTFLEQNARVATLNSNDKSSQECNCK